MSNLNRSFLLFHTIEKSRSLTRDNRSAILFFVLNVEECVFDTRITFAVLHILEFQPLTNQKRDLRFLNLFFLL